MIMKRCLFLLLFVFLFFSCGKTVFMSVKETDEKSNTIQGKSIAVLPFDIEFSASRFAIDLRDATIKINGQEIKLQNKYIVEDQDDYLGEIGIIDVNILKILGVSEEKIKKGASTIIKKVLDNGKNYNIPFFNGFGEGKSGYISNKELSIDQSTWPFTINYIEGEKEGPFKKVDIVRSEEEAKDKGYDLIIKGSIDLSNELAEIIDVPEETRNKYADWEFDKIPKVGQYYLLLKAYIDYEIMDLTRRQRETILLIQEIHWIYYYQSKKVVMMLYKNISKKQIYPNWQLMLLIK